MLAMVQPTEQVPFLGQARLVFLGQEGTETQTFAVKVLDPQGIPIEGIKIILVSRDLLNDIELRTDSQGVAETFLPSQIYFGKVTIHAFLPERVHTRRVSPSDNNGRQIFNSISVPTSVSDRPVLTSAEIVGSLGGIAGVIAGLFTSGDIGKGLVAVGTLATGVSIYSAVTRK